MLRSARSLLVALAAAALVAGTVVSPVAATATSSPAAGTASDGARVVGVRQVAPRQVDLTVSSPALGTTAPVRLLTPDGWRPGTHRHWPTLWLLHGCCGDYTSWTAMTDVAGIPALRHVLVVMPEAGTAGFYSNWWNHGTGGSPGWETFHLSEVRQIVEHGWGAGPDRTIAGLSMGGFGALSYAGRHPGMFRAAASYSGVVDPLYAPGGPENIEAILAGEGVDPTALWGDPVTQHRIWAAHDPSDLALALRRTPVFLSCGNGDPGPLDPPGTARNAFESLFWAEGHQLADRLTALHDRTLVTDFYGPGTHAWPYWQRELHRSLPMLLSAMGVHDRAA